MSRGILKYYILGIVVLIIISVISIKVAMICTMKINEGMLYGGALLITGGYLLSVLNEHRVKVGQLVIICGLFVLAFGIAL